jgi:uncharacterized protein (DUF1786 family)
VFFLDSENYKYVSVWYYPTRCYRFLIEFGGSHLSSIIIDDEYLSTLYEHLPKMCESMCRCTRYACKDSVFGLSYSGGNLEVARMYLDKSYII